MKRNFVDNLIDGYLKRPLTWDALAVVAIFLANYLFPIFEFKFLSSNDAINFLSNLISADVSLVGFILAALTIIVTFKSNIKAKGLDEANNALELILSSKHYPQIVKVFKLSIIELLIAVVVNYFFWLSITNFNTKLINIFILSGTLVTITALLRSLYILFFALTMEDYKRE